MEGVCMVRKEAARELVATVPPVSVSVATVAGFNLQEWVYILTAVYTIIQILRSFPKIYGCGRCFLANGTCTLICKKEVDPDA